MQEGLDRSLALPQAGVGLDVASAGPFQPHFLIFMNRWSRATSEAGGLSRGCRRNRALISHLTQRLAATNAATCPS